MNNYFSMMRGRKQRGVCQDAVRLLHSSTFGCCRCGTGWGCMGGVGDIGTGRYVEAKGNGYQHLTGDTSKGRYVKAIDNRYQIPDLTGDTDNARYTVEAKDKG